MFVLAQTDYKHFSKGQLQVSLVKAPQANIKHIFLDAVVLWPAYRRRTSEKSHAHIFVNLKITQGDICLLNYVCAKCERRLLWTVHLL